MLTFIQTILQSLKLQQTRQGVPILWKMVQVEDEDRLQYRGRSKSSQTETVNYKIRTSYFVNFQHISCN